MHNLQGRLNWGVGEGGQNIVTVIIALFNRVLVFPCINRDIVRFGPVNWHAFW